MKAGINELFKWGSNKEIPFKGDYSFLGTIQLLI